MPLVAAYAPVTSDDATEEQPINPKVLPAPGFVVKTFSMVDSQKWFLNCCAHDIVDRPLANGSQEQVDDEYLDSWCLSNVQVPLHVCSKRTTVDHAGEASIAIDVVFNPALTKRATAAKAKNATAFQEHMRTLALSHTEKEYGVRLDRKAGRVIRAQYKGGRGDGSLPIPIPELVAMEREQMLRAMGGQGQSAAPGGRGGAAAPAKKLVQEYDSFEDAEKAAAARKSSAAAAAAARSKSGGIGESAGRPVIKAGFLNKAGGKLYPTGSSEGTPAKDAGDPLGWMPEKLRSRVQMVDGNMSEEEQQRMMRVHAGLEENPKKQALREEREAKAAVREDERIMWAQVQAALPSPEELERITKDTDPEDFLNELRSVSENMTRLDAGFPAAAAAATAAAASSGDGGGDAGLSFAKKGFLLGGEGSGAAKARQPEYTLRGEAEAGGEAHTLELTVKLPGVESIAALQLDISSEMVLLHVPHGVELRLLLPQPIDEEAVHAKFSRKKGELRLTMPVKQ